MCKIKDEIIAKNEFKEREPMPNEPGVESSENSSPGGSQGLKRGVQKSLDSKLDGLNSRSKFRDFRTGTSYWEWHKHPETKELIIIRKWYYQSGEDDVDEEFEVEAVYEPIICELSMQIEELKNLIERLK